MTEPSKEAIERANTLIRTVTPENVLSSAVVRPDRNYCDDAFCRFIQEVSDVAKRAKNVLEQAQCGGRVRDDLDHFILPDPEPEVLAEAMREAFGAAAPEFVNAARNYIDKRGYEIRKVSE